MALVAASERDVILRRRHPQTDRKPGTAVCAVHPHGAGRVELETTRAGGHVRLGCGSRRGAEVRDERHGVGHVSFVRQPRRRVETEGGRRGATGFQLPIVLVSTTADAKTATLAAIASSLLVTAVQSLIVMPLLKYRDAEERAEAKERRAEFLEKAKRDADAPRSCSRGRSRRCGREEEAVEIDGKKKCGLLVARAVYGRKEVVCSVKYAAKSFAGREIEEEVIEVGDCVQALVENSQVQVVSTTKSTLMGFWDPSAFGDKEDLALKVWYWFRGEMHVCVVDDMEPLELPLSNHKVSSWS